jgi:hypothetical protein
VTENSDSPPTPEAGISEALHDLSDQTRALVRREVDAALREMWDKARRSGPAVALLAASGALALLAVASSYRLSLRLLERRLPPAASAFAATVGYGAAAAWAGIAGVRAIRRAPLPLPAETVREAQESVGEANRNFSPPVR